MLFLAALADIRTDRIPNKLIVFGSMAGIFSSLWTYQNVWQSAVSVTLAFLFMYPLFKIGAFGAGDVKVFMMVGCFLNVWEFVTVLAASFAVGACFSFLKILAEHNGKERMFYFLSYMREVTRTGEWKLYGESTVEDIRQYRRNKIHFTIPVLLSVALQIGGVI